MNKQEARQAWIREIIRRRCDGKIATFARAIGKDASYVSRMLYPADKKGAKGIGEDTVDLILAAFPESPLPSPAQPEHEAAAADDIARPLFTKERRASDDVTALRLGLQSLYVAVLRTSPGAAEVFLADLEAAAKEQKFSTKAGLLAELVGIARGVQRTEEEVSRVRQRAGSGVRKKP